MGETGAVEIPLGDVIEMLNGRPTDEVPEARDASSSEDRVLSRRWSTA